MMRWIAGFFSLLFLGLIGAGVIVLLVIQHYGRDLPDSSYLKDYRPPTLTRIYADDGRMMATIAAEQRIFVPLRAIPKRVIGAFLSAEDQHFYEHNGVDTQGILRAVLTNLQNLGKSRRPVGASTITQQVAKNMLVGNEVSLARKVREILLALNLERSLSKERILEIYLNEIFLGTHSYGVAAAALNYFNKSLDELTLGEAAYLAVLPKAPNNYHPVRDHEAAMARRAWVVGRMLDDGRITPDEADIAKHEPLVLRARDKAETVEADYATEDVRRQLVDWFGDKAVKEGGLTVKTSLSPPLQALATEALRNGLAAFDRRTRGWRGPVAHLDSLQGWQARLKAVPPPPGAGSWSLALVANLTKDDAKVVFVDGKRGRLPFSAMQWARRESPDGSFGPAVHKPADVLAVGDVVLLEPLTAEESPPSKPSKTTPPPTNEPAYALRQIPIVEGALVALDPHTGRVLAISGGFSSEISQFNRATQASRQPGSAFKPFVYLAALDKGFTPSSLILDAPFEYVQGPGMPVWRPENYSQEFYGPTPLRVGVEKSRNVMTVRLANSLGMPLVASYAKKFGIDDAMPEFLAFALGADETTLMRLTTAYGMIVNGGLKITPSLIDRVQNSEGKTLWSQDRRTCPTCQATHWVPDSLPPEIQDDREQIQDPRTAYQMVSILEGVAQRGTAARLKSLGLTLAGKTGTTNQSKDTWFIGFTPDLVCGVFVGFDDPKPLGAHETGASVALPIFAAFIQGATKGKPVVPFRAPPGLRMVRVNPATGALADPSDTNALWESFIPDTEPVEGQNRPVLEGNVTGAAAEGAAGALAIPTEGKDLIPGVEPGVFVAPGPVPEESAGSTLWPSSGKDAPPPPAAAPLPLGTGGLY